MRALRFSSRIALSVLPLSLAACLSYPLLDDEADSGEVDGVGSVGTGGTGTGGSGGTGGGSNTNGSNQNTNAEPQLPTSATGDVAQKLCDNFIVISERDGSRSLNVYELTGEGSFADWTVGDDTGFNPESGALLDFENDQNGTAQILGEYGGNTLFLSYNDITLSLTLQNGSVWVYSLDDAEEVRQWRTNSDLITQVDVDSSHAIIVNRTRCTSVAGSAQ